MSLVALGELLSAHICTLEAADVMGGAHPLPVSMWTDAHLRWKGRGLVGDITHQAPFPVMLSLSTIPEYS